MTGARRLSVDELADAAAMTPRNVRAYQSRGLLPPPYRVGRSAIYGPEHVARLRLVRALHQLGLSLKVVRDLLDRGEAEAELARLAREHQLGDWGRAARVPMSRENVTSFESAHPGVLDAMVDAGLLVREGDRVVASAAALGLTSALLARDVELEVSGRIAMLAARAASASLADLRAELDGVDGVDGEVVALAVQLAAVAYADVLARRLDLA